MDKKRLVLWVLVVLTLVFIFGQSLLSQDVSNKESETVQKQVVDPVHRVISDKETIPFDVRNIAHLTEFAILGLEFILLLRDKEKIIRWLKAISYCGFVALLDESIQYFSGRAPQVIDIWYDIFGAVIGATIMIMLVLIRKKDKKENIA